MNLHEDIQCLERDVFCVYEDRPEDLIAVRLLVVSLFAVHPNATLFLLGRGAASVELPKSLEAARIKRLPKFEVDASGWNVKPLALLELLRNEADAVTWLDSDIIFCGPLPRRYWTAARTALIVTEEYRNARQQGSSFRTRQWGLDPGVSIFRTVNTGLLGVTFEHIPLLESYHELLTDQRYTSAQALPFHMRPKHLAGDQDALTALLGSREFAGTELRWLRAGVEIAQCQNGDGFGVRDRLRSVVNSSPAIIHAQGLKPWRSYSDRPLQLDLSPYSAIARLFEEDLSLGKPEWINSQRKGFKFWNAVFWGNPWLRGVPTALYEKASRFYKRLARRWGLLRGSCK